MGRANIPALARPEFWLTRAPKFAIPCPKYPLIKSSREMMLARALSSGFPLASRLRIPSVSTIGLLARYLSLATCSSCFASSIFA
jgi:hypothetical protein